MLNDVFVNNADAKESLEALYQKYLERVLICSLCFDCERRILKAAGAEAGDCERAVFALASGKYAAALLYEIKDFDNKQFQKYPCAQYVKFRVIGFDEELSVKARERLVAALPDIFSSYPPVFFITDYHPYLDQLGYSRYGDYSYRQSGLL